MSPRSDSALRLAKTLPRIDLSIRLMSEGRISVGLPEHTDRLVAALSEQGGSGA